VTTLRVALDVRRGRWAPWTGIGRYVLELERSLAHRPDVRLTPLTSGRRTFASPLAKIAWEQVRAPVSAVAADLLHAPYYEVSPAAGRRLVLSVHDLDTLESPERYSRRVAAYNNPLLRLLARRARRVLSPSHYTAKRLDERLGIGEKLDVVPYGVSKAFFRPRASRPGPPYLLYTGGLSWRKNIPLLLELFAAVGERGYDGQLLVTGRVWPDVVHEYPALGRDRVVLTGELSEAQLASLYAGADALLYPSSLEGFGFPVLEAFAAGCPVVASRAGSIPEIAGECAVLCEPDDLEAFVDALERVLRDTELREELAQRGRTRAEGFTWARTADGTVASYRRVLA
jgi:glycosyltransferase involved in cell wall biosynthesis